MTTNICGVRRSEGSSPACRSRGNQEEAKSVWPTATWMRSCTSCSFSLVLPWEDGLQPWLLEVSGPEIHLCSRTSCRRSVWSVARAWIQSSLLNCAPAAISSRTESLKQSFKKKLIQLFHCVLSIKGSAFLTWRVCAVWSSRQGTAESWGRECQSSPGHQGCSLPLGGPPHIDADYWQQLSRADWPCPFLCHNHGLWQWWADWGHWEEKSKEREYSKIDRWRSVHVPIHLKTALIVNICTLSGRTVQQREWQAVASDCCRFCLGQRHCPTEGPRRPGDLPEKQSAKV